MNAESNTATYLTNQGNSETHKSTANINRIQLKDVDASCFYTGDDLGAIWSEEKTTFRLWAPTASEVVLNLYLTGNKEEPRKCISMKKDILGTWYLEIKENLNKVYYTYSVTVEAKTQEAVDPYARAVGVNGMRGMIIDISSTDPVGFTEDSRPLLSSVTDAIIYELHIRDFSIDDSSGMNYKGKYLAFTEKDTKTNSGTATGIEHLKELGITHVHLLPSFDFISVNEADLTNQTFNWGYDPQNYNVPEGSYATNPYEGEVRIKEFKQMVQALHTNGIRVVMDVVYNHTAESETSNFNKIVPGYYYRMTKEGQFSNASACGNETASENAMMRKFIIDSVVYWATQYHIDGFRFDLMGIHNIDTMNSLRLALDAIDPSILIYGEGWTGGPSQLPIENQALKANMVSMDARIAAFSDDIRDGIKGSVFEKAEKGYVSGEPELEETIKFGIVAATWHPQVDYAKVKYSKKAWAKEPSQSINYASAHDNLTLWDKLASSNASEESETRMKMNLLSAAIVLTSQGIPFFQAGEEFLRSKPVNDSGTQFDENSYKSSDAVNSLKWDSIEKNYEVYQYYKGLIAFRKAHRCLRMTSTSEIVAKLSFYNDLPKNVVGYSIESSIDESETICILYNANKTTAEAVIPKGNWKVYVKGIIAGTEVLETIAGGRVMIEPISTLVLIKE